MEKQTAVDILYKFLYEMESFEGFDPYSFNHKDVFNKAKEMEKEQNKLWWSKGWHEGHMSTLQENTETFKNK
jgi:hypothetical protein